MLSAKLIRLIETHEGEIAARILESIRRNPGLQHLARVPSAEILERRRELLRNLGHYLAHGHEQELATDYEAIGRRRFEEDVPLEECVQGICLTKEAIVEFLDAQGFNTDTLALWSEGQLIRRFGQFFDLLLCRLVRGYERARRCAVHAL